MVASAQRTQKLQRGLTLLETLVTLVVASAIVSTGFMMLAQLNRAEQLLADTRLQDTQRAVQKEWLRQLLSGLIPDYEDGPARFRGSEKSITGLSSGLIEATGGLGRFQLELAFNAELGTTELSYREAPDRPPTVLLTVPGAQAHFLYLDATGRTAATWPPPMSDAPQLPRAIILASPGAHAIELIVAPHAAPTPLLRRADLLKL